MTNNDYVFIGEIRLFPYDFNVDGWLPCDGRPLPVGSDYLALYSLLRNRFGGLENTSFNLPKIPTIVTSVGTQVGYFIAVTGNYPTRQS